MCLSETKTLLGYLSMDVFGSHVILMREPLCVSVKRVGSPERIKTKMRGCGTKTQRGENKSATKKKEIKLSNSQFIRYRENSGP